MFVRRYYAVEVDRRTTVFFDTEKLEVVGVSVPVGAVDIDGISDFSEYVDNIGTVAKYRDYLTELVKELGCEKLEETLNEFIDGIRHVLKDFGVEVKEVVTGVGPTLIDNTASMGYFLPAKHRQEPVYAAAIFLRKKALEQEPFLIGVHEGAHIVFHEKVGKQVHMRIKEIAKSEKELDKFTHRLYVLAELFATIVEADHCDDELWCAPYYAFEIYKHLLRYWRSKGKDEPRDVDHIVEEAVKKGDVEKVLQLVLD